MYQEEKETIWNNYLNEVSKNIDKEEYELMLSYTKAVLPVNKEEYTLVIVYGLSEKSPMKLLTNIEINGKEDVIKVARFYLSRWRIEDHFRGKKQE